LNQKNLAKITEIVSRRNPSLASVLKHATDLLALGHEARKNIASVLSDEFSEFGLEEDGEPNKYGIEIELLIGECNLTHK
jgi:hypothetical protein